MVDGRWKIHPQSTIYHPPIRKDDKMGQQFNQQNFKKRTSTLVFLKGSTAPLVLYVEKPEALYDELQKAMQNTNAVVIEKETQGPLKKVLFISNQIAAVALQEEQYV